MTKFINRKYITKCIELMLCLLHYKISYQSYVKIESHIKLKKKRLLNILRIKLIFFVLNYITCFLILFY